MSLASNETLATDALTMGAGLTVVVLGLAGLTTNCLLLLATWRSQELRNRCNALIVALALCDLTLSSSAVGQGASFVLQVRGVGAFPCFFAFAPYIFASVLGMELGVILAVDRGFAILWPFRYEAFPPVVYIATLLLLGSIYPLFATVWLGYGAYEMRSATFPICSPLPPWLPHSSKIPITLSISVFGFAGLGLNLLVYVLIKQKYKNSAAVAGKVEPLDDTGGSNPSRRGSDVSKRRQRQKASKGLLHRQLQISLVMVTLCGILPKLFVTPWFRITDKVLSGNGSEVAEQIVKAAGLWALLSVTICSNFFIFYGRSNIWRGAFKSIFYLLFRERCCKTSRTCELGS